MWTRRNPNVGFDWSNYNCNIWNWPWSQDPALCKAMTIIRQQARVLSSQRAEELLNSVLQTTGPGPVESTPAEELLNSVLQTTGPGPVESTTAEDLVHSVVEKTGQGPVKSKSWGAVVLCSLDNRPGSCQVNELRSSWTLYYRQQARVLSSQHQLRSCWTLYFRQQARVLSSQRTEELLNSVLQTTGSGSVKSTSWGAVELCTTDNRPGSCRVNTSWGAVELCVTVCRILKI
jgi:hypothetical protein